MNNPMSGAHVPFAPAQDNTMFMLLFLLMMNPGMFGDNMMLMLLLFMMMSGGKFF